MIHAAFIEHLPGVNSLFKKYRVTKAYVFGSVCTDKFNSQSDVDMLISFEDNLDPLIEGETWWKLHEELQRILNRPVDLVVEKSLRNPYFKEELFEKRQLIYG